MTGLASITHREENIFLRLLALIALIYIFIVSIQLFGASFKLFGKEFATGLFTLTSNPLVGLLIGVLSTTLVQSSSTTTSLVVGLVAAGTLNLEGAIPIIMGANIGTTVTNTLVSLGHISRKEEFRRAFAASTVHDMFNVLSVIVILPIQMATGFLGRFAEALTGLFQNIGGFAFTSPLKAATKPVAEGLLSAIDATGFVAESVVPIVGCILGLALLMFALRYIVNLLKGLILGRVENFFQRYLFGNPAYSFILGIMLTTFVQSSSISTSIVIPLVGAGILTVVQIFPYTLGSNIGTTTTALLAGLATGEPAGLAVAFAHLLFNLSGIAIFWPLSFIPLKMADVLAGIAVRSKVIPILYLIIVFYALPGALIFLMR